MPADNEQTGIPLDSPVVRYERMVETIHIIKSFFVNDSVTFKGKHYQVSGLAAYPKPVQQPHPPLLMGARGPRMLQLAAKEADIIGVMGPDDSAAERMATLRRRSRRTLCALGIQCALPASAGRGRAGRASIPEFSNMASLSGSRSEIIEYLQRRRDSLHVSYIAVIGTAMDAFAPVVAELAGK